MSTEALIELERRVRRAEEQVAAARSEIARLRERPRLTGRFVASFVAGAVFAVAGGFVATTVGAQSGGQTVRAPFAVLGSNGKTIFDVTEEGAKSTGVAGKGGWVRIINTITSSESTFTADAWRMNIQGKAKVVVRPEDATDGKSDVGIRFYSDPGLSAYLGQKSSKGYLELNDAAGNIMIEAGVLKANKGYVLANPSRASTSPQGDPSVLKGGGK